MDRTRRHPLRGVTMTVWTKQVACAIAATTFVVGYGVAIAGPTAARVTRPAMQKRLSAQAGRAKVAGSAHVQVAAAPVAAVPVTTAPVAAAPVTTAPVAAVPGPTVPVAAVPVAATPEPVNSAPVTSVPVAAAPVPVVPIAGASAALPFALPPALLQSSVGHEVIVIDRAADGATKHRRRLLSESPFVSIIDADAHRGEQLSVASALIAAPGTQVRSLGGLGTFSSVSVRGAAAGHTAVLVNGVPLSRIASVTADLGGYSLESFATVELFRGALPLELSGGGVGGAVNMVTRLGRTPDGERLRMALGSGSFGARNLNVWHGDRIANTLLATSTTVAYAAARGDFTVFSDNGTPLVTDDDGLMQRAHNGYWSVEANSRIGTVDQSWSAGVRALVKTQELPGSLYYPAQQASLATRNLIADATKRSEWRRDDVPVLVATHRVYSTVEQQRFADPGNEIGLAAQERAYLTLAGGGQTQWTAAVGDHELTALGQAQAERFVDGQAGVDDRATSRGNRVGAAVGVGAALHLGARLTAEPGLRVDWMRTAPPIDGNAAMAVALPARQQWLPSPRASLRYLIAADIVVKGSAGWYARVPTVTELFGDRGFFAGSPGLLPERGPAAEVGAVWAPGRALGAIDRVLVEASGFGNQSRNTIVYVTQGGFVTRPLNIGDTMAGGGELAMSARLWRAISASANYSLMYSTQRNSEPSYNGKELPRRPRHRGYARIDAAGTLMHHRIGGFVDGSWQAHSYLDQGNLEQAPARWLLGVGMRVDMGAGLTLSAELKNVTDNRTERPSGVANAAPTAIVDVAGFPLPGRALYARLEWSY